MLLATPVVVLAQGSTVAKSGYVAVHGLKMYYIIQGAGRPLVLLHGALSNIDTDFGKMLPELAKQRQVIAVEQQAHGHTADIDRPLTYAQMAEDTAELLRQLKIERADFFGHSMGGAWPSNLRCIIRNSLESWYGLEAPALTLTGFIL